MAASSAQTRNKRPRAARHEKQTSGTRSKAKAKAKSTDDSSTGTGTGVDDERDEDYGVKETEDDEDAEEDVYDSDAIDEDDFVVGDKRKRRATGSTRSSPSKKKASSSSSVSPRKKKKTNAKRGRGKGEDEDGDEDGIELEDGQEVIGVVVQAPTTGQVPPGQVSQNTFDFLTCLKDPECNDRQWFKLHEPVYRQAENEWKAFIEVLTESLTEADPQVPPLPPKDVIHRIYRDVRFSNDKTPYKKGFSASFSRSGRKGIWAGYHVAVKPGNESLVAAGSWCPGRAELANIRANILRPAGANRLREVLSNPEFVAYFGEPRPSKDGSRQSVFGADDELKVAPKGVDKNHRDIDLLKCRSFAVVHHFLDSEALAEDFAEKVTDVVRVMCPFVHCINDMMTVSPEEEESEDEGSSD